MKLISSIRNLIRSAIFSGIMIFGLAGLVYTPASLAGDNSSMSGKSGQGSTAADKSSDQGSQQKKQSGSKSGQAGSSTSGSGVLEEERTGVTGDTPSGRGSETSGQKRGPSGY
jgi:hypothetical protein